MRPKGKKEKKRKQKKKKEKKKRKNGYAHPTRKCTSKTRKKRKISSSIGGSSKGEGAKTEKRHANPTSKEKRRGG